MDRMFYVRVDFYGCVCVCARFISVIHCILMIFGIGDRPSLLVRDFRFNPDLSSYNLNTQIKSAFLNFL